MPDDHYKLVAAACLVTAEAEIRMLRAERAAKKARDAYYAAKASEEKAYAYYATIWRRKAKGGGDAD